MIRVAVVDDQPLLVSAFAALVDAQPDLVVVGTGADGREAVALCAGTDVDVLLLDIRMPVLDGVEATRLIVDAGPLPRVVILTTFNVDELVLGALAAGARGFLLKDAEPTDVLDAVRAVHAGRAVVDPQATPALLDALRSGRASGRQGDPHGEPERPPGPSPLAGVLTPREIEVLTLVGRGRTNAEICAELFIAETTVKTHVSSLLLKLDARDRVALVVLAHSVGLVGAGRDVPLP